MQVKSTRFGILEVPDDKVLSFPDGLLGFEQFHRYVILEHDPGTPFKWLQCLDDADVAFVIINPAEFAPEYVIELGRDDVVKLGLKDVGEAAVYVLVVIPEDPSAMTANLQGPLVLNADLRVGRQVVLPDGRYRTRQPILEALRATRAKAEGDRKTDTKGCAPPNRRSVPGVAVAR